MSLTSRPRILAASLLAVVAQFATINVDASTVVLFDGVNNAYGTTSSANFNMPTAVHPDGTNTYIYGYNADVNFSPNSNYTGPKFYGGGWVTSSNGSVTGFSHARVRRDYTNQTPTTYQSALEFGTSSHSGVTTSGATFIAFQSADFVDGNSSTYSLNNTSSLSLQLTTGSQSVVRFALESEGQWYLSSASVVSVANKDAFLSLTGQDLLDSTWGLWDPTGGANGRLGDVPTDFSISASTFGNIGAVGYYTTLNSSASNQYAYIGKFQADLETAAVPEPSTYALLFLSAVGVVLVLKRRSAALSK